MRRAAAFMVALGGVLLTGMPARAADAPIEGVWRVVESGGRPAAGLYIFTKTHYSMVLALPDRPDVADTSKATADELRAVWGPLIANTGEYEVAGDRVTIRPTAAKIPVVMKPGANEVYEFRVEGKNLYFAQRRNARGRATQGAMTKLERVE